MSGRSCESGKRLWVESVMVAFGSGGSGMAGLGAAHLKEMSISCTIEGFKAIHDSLFGKDVRETG